MTVTSQQSLFPKLQAGLNGGTATSHACQQDGVDEGAKCGRRLSRAGSECACCEEVAGDAMLLIGRGQRGKTSAPARFSAKTEPSNGPAHSPLSIPAIGPRARRQRDCPDSARDLEGFGARQVAFSNFQRLVASWSCLAVRCAPTKRALGCAGHGKFRS
jgi:hypothetical protein